MTQKEKILGFMKENMKIPMTAEEMAVMLSVPKQDMTEFFNIIEELELEGKIVKTKKKRFATGALLGLVTGKFTGNERGFGFVEPEENGGADNFGDVFIGAENTGGALHGDIVMAKIITKPDGDRRREGEIVKIVQPAEHKIVGRFTRNENTGFVVPVYRRYATDFYIEPGNRNGAQDGDMVVAELLKRGSGKKSPEAKIISVIGNINTPGMDILSVIESRSVSYEFDEDILNAAKHAAKTVSLQDTEGRLDLRSEQIITIDGDDAKDLDDAVHVKKLENGRFELGVHIADVGNYVPVGGKIDREAYLRGTSIYLADRVIPMLPEVLSNGICSLNEGEDRLTLSVIMEIDKSGVVVDHKIYESVICSSKRMTYTDVTAIVEGDEEKRERFSDLVEMIGRMVELRAILRKKRVSRGSIDFNFDEARIVLDENGKPIDIVKRERGVSNSMIEEFMLVCNETVAEHMFWLNIPFVYRVNEEPDPDTMKEFAKFIAPLGYSIKHSNGKVHPRELAALIRSLTGKREEMIISSVALRSLMKARYSNENLGHFGLAAKYYCHFTSPIRRYPDLCIHRIIKDHLNGRLNVKKLAAFTAEAAKQSSDRELEAVDLERTIEDMKKAEFMHDRVGDVYSAVITSITPFGMFAALENTIEGLIRLADLNDDYYIYDEKTRSISGEHNGKTFQVGETIEIRVARADPQSGKIDFVLNTQENDQNSRRKAFFKKHREQVKTKKNTKIKTAKYLKKRQKKH